MAANKDPVKPVPETSNDGVNKPENDCPGPGNKVNGKRKRRRRQVRKAGKKQKNRENAEIICAADPTWNGHFKLPYSC